MDANEMKKRTMQFALTIIKIAQSLPKDRTAEVIGRQLLRCGTSVGANYRAACKARSRAEFIAKMGIVEEEADETAYWLELIVDSGLLKERDVATVMNEARQIVAMTAASRKTAKKKAR